MDFLGISDDASRIVIREWSYGQRVYVLDRSGKMLVKSYLLQHFRGGHALSSDGKYLVVGTKTGIVVIDCESGSILASYWTGESTSNVKISSDGSYIVARGGLYTEPYKRIYLWRLNTY